MVHAPHDVVEHLLLVGDAEPGVDLLPDVGAAVAVRVLEVEEVRRRRDEEPPFPDRHAGGPDQLVGEDLSRFVVAVSVPVLQHANPARAVLARPRLARVAVELGHVHAPVLVEGGGQRFHHLRLVGRQLHPEALGGLDGLQGFGRIQRRYRFQVLAELIRISGDIGDPPPLFPFLIRTARAGGSQEETCEHQNPVDPAAVCGFQVPKLDPGGLRSTESSLSHGDHDAPVVPGLQARRRGAAVSNRRTGGATSSRPSPGAQGER